MSDASRDTVSASATVDAPAADVFDFVRRPANHPIISGDGSVQENRFGPEVLGAGDRFGMAMKLGVPYRITNTVVDFEENRKIAWCHPGKHRWIWEIADNGDGTSTVTETYDQTYSRAPWLLRLFGYPGRHQDNVERSVRNVAAHFEGS